MKYKKNPPKDDFMADVLDLLLFSYQFGKVDRWGGGNGELATLN